jgi:hypothetical protein
VTEPFIENLEDPEVAKSRKSIINSIIERRAKKPKLYLWLTPEKADKAIELVETVLEAGAGRADKAIELVETVLEAGAGQADEAVDIVIEAILEAEERIGEEANEIIVIDSITETIIDKIAGRVVAGGDKIAEEVAELLVDQPIEAIREAVDRVGEEANEIIVEEIIINSITEAINDNTVDPFVELAILKAAELAVDPFVGLAVLEAVDRVDEETDEDIVEEIVINSSIEATIDNTVDPSIEAILVAEEQVDEFTVDPSIEAIQSRRTNRQRS